MNFQSNRESFLKLTINKLTTIISILLEVIKQKEKEEPEPARKIVGEIEKEGIFFYQILIVGTGQVVDRTPSSLLSDTKRMMEFNKIDFMTITNKANFEKYEPKAKISSIALEEKIIEIQSRDQGKKIINLDESNDIDNIVETLSKKHAFDLGVLIGEENCNFKMKKD